jgi:phage terminase Nu1 subunit (DNA packaging protein)
MSKIKTVKTELSTVSLERLSRFFNVEKRTINKWVKDHGAPRDARGLYDLEKFIHWRENYWRAQLDAAKRGDETESQARARRERAEATLKEIELAKELRQVITREDVDDKLIPLITRTAQKISNIGRMLEQNFPGKISKEMLQMVTKHTDDMRNDLATVSFGDDKKPKRKKKQ